VFVISVLGVRVIVFNATFNNISVISWRSVLLVEKTRFPEKTTNLSQVTDNLYHIMEGCYVDLVVASSILYCNVDLLQHLAQQGDIPLNDKIISTI
jgi:hypothetical protein